MTAAVSVVSPLPQTPPADLATYLAALEPPGTGAFLWVAHQGGSGAPLQRWGTADQIWSWLRGMNAAGRSVYVTLASHLSEPWTGPVADTPCLVRGPAGATVEAPLHTLSTTHGAIRTASTIRRARVAKLDIDDGGETFLARLDSSTLPAPTLVVETSPGRFQALWALASGGADLQTVRAVDRALAKLFGGDPAVVDAARVFRVPGLINPKHSGGHLVQLVRHTPAARYALGALAAAAGADAEPVQASSLTPPPATTAPTWTPEQVTWRNTTWATAVLGGLSPLEFNKGTSTNAAKRAVFLAADYGFTAEDVSAPECLGAWLDAAVVHPRQDGTRNPDEADRAGFVRRMYQSCLHSRAEAVGFKISEEWFRRGLTRGLFPDSYPPAPADAAAPPPVAPTGARTLPTLSPQGIALHFSQTEDPPPVADAQTGEVAMFDAGVGLYRAMPKDNLERLVVNRYHNAPAVDVANPGRNAVVVWKTQRMVEDTLRALQRVALDTHHGPRGGVGFSDGTLVYVDPETSGVVVHPRGPPAARLGVGAYHYPFEHIPGALPPVFLKWLLSCFTDDDRAAKVLLLRQWMGAAILGAARRTATAVVLQGQPSTGKSVLLNLLRAVMPDMWGLVSPAELGEEYTRARLATSRLLVMPDNVDAHGFRHFKSIISDDPPLSARDPYGRKHQISPQCGVVLACNGRLVIQEDPQDGIWRRLAPVVFTRRPVDPGERRDVVAEVLAAGEIPLIVSWALEGARDLADARWTLPAVPAVEDERAAWQRHGNSFLDWLTTQTDFRRGPAGAGTAAAVTFGDLYEAYGFDCGRFGIQHKMGLARAFGCFRYLHRVEPPEDMRRGVAVGWTRSGASGTAPPDPTEVLRALVDPVPPPAPVPLDVLSDLADAWHWDARVRETWAELAAAPMPEGVADLRTLAQITGFGVEAISRCLRTELDNPVAAVPWSARLPAIRRVVRLKAPGRARP